MKTENVQILFYGICEKKAIQNVSQKLYNLLSREYNCTIYCPVSPGLSKGLEYVKIQWRELGLNKDLVR